MGASRPPHGRDVRDGGRRHAGHQSLCPGCMGAMTLAMTSGSTFCWGGVACCWTPWNNLWQEGWAWEGLPLQLRPPQVLRGGAGAWGSPFIGLRGGSVCVTPSVPLCPRRSLPSLLHPVAGGVYPRPGGYPSPASITPPDDHAMPLHSKVHPISGGGGGVPISIFFLRHNMFLICASSKNATPPGGWEGDISEQWAQAEVPSDLSCV